MAKLPPSRKLLQSADASDIANAIRSVVGTNALSHFDIVMEAPRSGRVLLQKPTATSVPLPNPYLAYMMAKELLGERLLSESRFGPEPQAMERFAKGWEVHKLVIEGTAAVLVWATWIPVKSHALQ